MNETYSEMKHRHQSEFDALPCFAAFSMEQFTEGKKRLGIVEDRDLARVGFGMYCRASDAASFEDYFNRTHSERAAAMADDDFLCGAFCEELYNHEYNYTYDAIPAIEAVGIDWEEYRADDRLQRVMGAAIAKVKASYIDYEGRKITPGRNPRQSHYQQGAENGSYKRNDEKCRG